MKKLLIITLLLYASFVFADTQPVLDMAENIGTDTIEFDNNLSSDDDDIQKALETLDEMAAGESTTVSDTTTVDLTLTGSDITADGLYTAGDYLTLTGADFDVDDDFLLNTGDSGTGTYDFTGATEFLVPDATSQQQALNYRTALNLIGVSLTWWLQGSNSLGLTYAVDVQERTETVDELIDTLTNIYYVSTVADTPTPFTIKEGTEILAHFQAAVDSTGIGKTVTLSAQLFYATSYGVGEVQIGNDGVASGNLTTSKFLYENYIIVPTETIVPAGKVILLKFIATPSTLTGYSPTVSIWDGDIHDHISIGVSGSILGRFVQKAGDTMTGNLTMSGSSANIVLGSNYLSGDGDDEGISVGSTGSVALSEDLIFSKSSTSDEDIQVSARHLYIQCNSVEVPAYQHIGFLANTGKDASFELYSNGGAGNWSPYISWEVSYADTTATMLSDAPFGIQASADYDDYLRFQTSSDIPEITTVGLCDLKINAGGSNDLLLNDAGGNVGIGTTGPSGTLHIYGTDTYVTTVERVTAITNDIRSELYLKHTTSGDMVDGFGAGFNFQIEDSAGVTNDLGNFAAVMDGADNRGAYSFRLVDDAGYTEKMRITNAGNVGIGTTDPQTALDVSGTITATGYDGLGQALVVTFDGGGSAIAADTKWYGTVPHGVTLKSWYIIGDASGAIVFDIWTDTWGTIPDNDDSICNGHEPTITASAQYASDTDITDWSGEALTGTDMIIVNVDSAVTITKATLTVLYEVD